MKLEDCHKFGKSGTVQLWAFRRYSEKPELLTLRIQYYNNRHYFVNDDEWTEKVENYPYNEVFETKNELINNRIKGLTQMQDFLQSQIDALKAELDDTDC